MPPPTPPVKTDNRALVERFLRQDPVTTAVAWNRAFDMEGPKEVYVVGDPPQAMLAIARPFHGEAGSGIAMHAVEPHAAQELMAAWPKGTVFLHLTEDWMLPLVQARAESFEGGPFWLFQLDPKDFRGRPAAEVRPLDPQWSDLIGKVWDPTWDLAPAHVRTRIEAGHAYAVYEDGKPVAWAFLHFETPVVSMMGFLHVLEPYRGKGYARAVSAALIRDILARGKIPALHVKTDNVPSLELTASLGFHRVKRQIWGDAVMR